MEPKYSVTVTPLSGEDLYYIGWNSRRYRLSCEEQATGWEGGFCTDEMFSVEPVPTRYNHWPTPTYVCSRHLHLIELRLAIKVEEDHLIDLRYEWEEQMSTAEKQESLEL